MDEIRRVPATGPAMFSSIVRRARTALGDNALCGKDGFAGASVKFDGAEYRHARYRPHRPFAGIAAHTPPNAKKHGGAPGRRRSLEDKHRRIVSKRRAPYGSHTPISSSALTKRPPGKSIATGRWVNRMIKLT